MYTDVKLEGEDEALTEEEHIKKTANHHLRIYGQSYLEKERTRICGTRSYNESLKLREDYYAYMFVHKLKRKEVFANRGTESDSEDEIKAVLDADQHLEEDERPYSRQGEMFYKGFKTHRTLITGQFYFLVFA